VLFAIIFIWTPPHFWSLALCKAADYGRAGIPMAPNVWGPDRTRLHILVYSLVLAPVGLAPWLLGFAGPAYGVVSLLGGVGMVYGAINVFRQREGDKARKIAMGNFGFSILYLFALFGVLVLERIVLIGTGVLL
jgi:protoheme IX farnesyltransferase